jgi:hypothetical protein
LNVVIQIDEFPIAITPTPTGDLPAITLLINVTEENEVEITLTHQQSGQQVTYKALELREDEEIELQEHTPPEWSEEDVERYKGSFSGRSWTREQLEKLVHAAKEAIDLAKNSTVSEKNKAVLNEIIRKLDIAISKAHNTNYNNLNNDCPYIYGRITELLNRLCKFRQINRYDYDNYLNELRKIERETQY